MLPFPMPRRLLMLTLVLIGSGAGCADRLPDQDLRILQAVPVAKLPTDILWQEYQKDQKAADRKYWGKAVEVTGKVTSVVNEPPARMLFAQSEAAAGVQAGLLDDRAAATLADVAPGQRITLRCFCEGLATHVILKSCIRP
jgi:tRNA_anti-like